MRGASTGAGFFARRDIVEQLGADASSRKERREQQETWWFAVRREEEGGDRKGVRAGHSGRALWGEGGQW